MRLSIVCVCAFVRVCYAWLCLHRSLCSADEWQRPGQTHFPILSIECTSIEYAYNSMFYGPGIFFFLSSLLLLLCMYFCLFVSPTFLQLCASSKGQLFDDDGDKYTHADACECRIRAQWPNKLKWSSELRAFFMRTCSVIIPGFIDLRRGMKNKIFNEFFFSSLNF